MRLELEIKDPVLTEVKPRHNIDRVTGLRCSTLRSAVTTLHSSTTNHALLKLFLSHRPIAVLVKPSKDMRWPLKFITRNLPVLVAIESL